MTSRILVNNIYSFSGAGVSFLQGFNVASGFGVTFSGDVKIDGAFTLSSGSFNGDGSAITNLPTATPSRTFAYSSIV